MAPHPRGDEPAFVAAFTHCRNALSELNLEHLEDETARHWFGAIERLTITDGRSFEQRAREMTLEEKQEFSQAVDELASYFDGEFWSYVSHRET